MTTTAATKSAPDRVAAAAADLESLANSSISESVFFQGYLQRVVDAFDAVAGAVWFLTPQGVPGLGCDVRLADTGVTRDPAMSRLNLRRLMDVASAGKPALHDGLTESDAGDAAVLLVPIESVHARVGIVQLFLDGRHSHDDRLDARQFVEESAGSVKRYLAWREEAGSPAGNLEFSARFEQAIVELHRDLDVKAVAMTAVQEGSRLLGCDRVCVVLKRGGRAVVAAVSGQARPNPRSNPLRSLAALAAAVIRSNRPLASSGMTEDLPLPVEALLLDHLKSSGTRMVKVIPLADPAPRDEPGAPRRRRPRQPRAFGALVLEQVADEWLTPVVSSRADRFAEHVARALRNARVHESVFLLPMRKAAGRFVGWFQGRTLAWLLALMTMLAAGIAALTMVAAPYRVEAKGRLMPVVQRDVFAPWDAEVAEVMVAAGDRVAEGQPLLSLRNDELRAQLLLARNRLAEKQQQREALRAEVDDANRRTSRPEDAVRLRGRIAQTEIELEAATLRVSALETQLESLTVRAPVSGVVATHDVERLLANRPVRRGETLLEIMDDEGEWRLEADVPEHRMGHLLAAQRNRRDAPLPVEFVLATNPEATHSGTLDEVATRARTTTQDGTVVSVHIAVARDDLPNSRIGAEAVAKIDCGQTSLAYVLFGDAVEFIQKRLW